METALCTGHGAVYLFYRSCQYPSVGTKTDIPIVRLTLLLEFWMPFSGIHQHTCGTYRHISGNGCLSFWRTRWHKHHRLWHKWHTEAKKIHCFWTYIEMTGNRCRRNPLIHGYTLYGLPHRVRSNRRYNIPHTPACRHYMHRYKLGVMQWH